MNDTEKYEDKSLGMESIQDTQKNNAEEHNDKHGVMEGANEKPKGLNKKIIMYALLGVGALFIVGLQLKELIPKENNIKEEKISSSTGKPNFNAVVPETISFSGNIDKIEENPINPLSGYKNSKNYPGGYKEEEPERKLPVIKTTGISETDNSYKDAILQQEIAEENAARRAMVSIPLNTSKTGMSGIEFDKTYKQNTSFDQSDDYMNNALAQLNDSLSAVNQIPVQQSGNGTSSGSTPTQGEEYRSANMQDNKKTFSSENTGNVVQGSKIDEYTVAAGTVIPGVLLTGINTDLPGDVLGMVTQNVYDTLTGKNIIISQGTKILASYNSSVSWGQSRIQISWTRMIRPDGVTANIGNMTGIDSKGFSGYQGWVNEHPLKYLQGITAIALFTILNGQINALVQDGQINEGLSELIGNTTEPVNDIAKKYIDKTMDIQPTLIANAGAKINIFVNTDIRLPPNKMKRPDVKYRRTM